MEKKTAVKKPTVLIAGFSKTKASAIVSCINNHSIQIAGGFHEVQKALHGSKYHLVVLNADNFSDRHLREIHSLHESKTGEEERSVAVCSDKSKRSPERIKKSGIPLVRNAELPGFLISALSQA